MLVYKETPKSYKKSTGHKPYEAKKEKYAYKPKSTESVQQFKNTVDEESKKVFHPKSSKNANIEANPYLDEADLMGDLEIDESYGGRGRRGRGHDSGSGTRKVWRAVIFSD